jgi:hypothetical protein
MYLYYDSIFLIIVKLYFVQESPPICGAWGFLFYKVSLANSGRTKENGGNSNFGYVLASVLKGHFGHVS